jgi:hypothetical protein
MSDDESFVFIISGLVALAGLGVTSTGPLHPLHFRNNAAIGLVRIAVWLAMAWIGFVLWRYADPSVTGVYVWFYLVMGLAVVKMFGQKGCSILGLRFRVDVCERKNLSSALFVAAFILGTGLIFGGSLWGQADPDGDGEGGWWIPVPFFLLGWAGLVVTMLIFLWREPGMIREQLLQNRNWDDAKAAAACLVGVALIMTETVAGDFHGWRHGLFSFAVVGVMLAFHEAAMFVGDRLGDGATGRVPRELESWFYLMCGAGSWGLSWLLEGTLNPPS